MINGYRATTNTSTLHTEAVHRELDVMRRLGFRGRRMEPTFTCVDAGHCLVVVNYLFDDGTLRTYVEVSESHDDGRRARVVPLPELVHLAQNVGAMELFEIGARDGRPA